VQDVEFNVTDKPRENFERLCAAHLTAGCASAMNEALRTLWNDHNEPRDRRFPALSYF